MKESKPSAVEPEILRELRRLKGALFRLDSMIHELMLFKNEKNEMGEKPLWAKWQSRFDIQILDPGLRVVYHDLIPSFKRLEVMDRGLSREFRDQYLWPLASALADTSVRFDTKCCLTIIHYFDRDGAVDVDNRAIKWLTNAFRYAGVIPDDSSKWLEIYTMGVSNSPSPHTELFLYPVEEFMKHWTLLHREDKANSTNFVNEG